MGRKSENDDTNDRNLAVWDMKITVASIRIIFNGVLAAHFRFAYGAFARYTLEVANICF